MAYPAAAQLDALGDPTRRAILERLMNGPLAVVDIADTLPISRPAVSQHLKVLKEARLVVDEAEGTRRVYRIDQRGLATVREYFDQFWDEALDAFKNAAEETYAATARDRRSKQTQPRKERKR
jgi:DNA-binding transcriptional ArsR family regulator